MQCSGFLWKRPTASDGGALSASEYEAFLLERLGHMPDSSAMFQENFAQPQDVELVSNFQEENQGHQHPESPKLASLERYSPRVTLTDLAGKETSRAAQKMVLRVHHCGLLKENINIGGVAGSFCFSFYTGEKSRDTE